MDWCIEYKNPDIWDNSTFLILHRLTFQKILSESNKLNNSCVARSYILTALAMRFGIERRVLAEILRDLHKMGLISLSQRRITLIGGRELC